MLLLAIAALVILLGFFGLRNSSRTYVLIAAIAVVLSYVNYTR